MKTLLHEIRRNPLLWLLAFVPVVLVAVQLKPEAHTMLFVLSVLAIVPLVTLMSHATESVAAKTGDGVGGLFNATLGNLTGGPTTPKNPTTAPSGVCVSASRSYFQNSSANS